jgi:hypothetical protein
MTRLLSFSLLVTPAIGKEVRYLFASRKALLSFAGKLMRERFVGSRIPFVWDQGVWVLDMQIVKEFEEPFNFRAVFEQVAVLFHTFAQKENEFSDGQKEELREAVQHAFSLTGIEWFLPIEEEPSHMKFLQERRNNERDLPEGPYSSSTFQGIPLTNKPPGT